MFKKFFGRRGPEEARNKTPESNPKINPKAEYDATGERLEHREDTKEQRYELYRSRLERGKRVRYTTTRGSTSGEDSLEHWEDIGGNRLKVWLKNPPIIAGITYPVLEYYLESRGGMGSWYLTDDSQEDQKKFFGALVQIDTK